MWNLEKWHRGTCLQSTNSNRHREEKYGQQGEEWGWDELGDWDSLVWMNYHPVPAKSAFGAAQVALVVKNPPANAGDMGLIPGLGRSPGGRNGNPLHYSCLENPMDRGACLATVHVVAKSQTRLKRLGMHALHLNYTAIKLMKKKKHWKDFHNFGASQMVLAVKNLLASAGDTRDASSIPGSGRFPGRGHSNPL